jgi:hypothetical protein
MRPKDGKGVAVISACYCFEFFVSHLCVNHVKGFLLSLLRCWHEAVR